MEMSLLTLLLMLVQLCRLFSVIHKRFCFWDDILVLVYSNIMKQYLFIYDAQFSLFSFISSEYFPSNMHGDHYPLLRISSSSPQNELWRGRMGGKERKRCSFLCSQFSFGLVLVENWTELPSALQLLWGNYSDYSSWKVFLSSSFQIWWNNFINTYLQYVIFFLYSSCSNHKLTVARKVVST